MIKKIFILFCYVLPVLVFAQDAIVSGVYEWKQPVRSNRKLIQTAVLFEGSVYDMEWLQMNANELGPSKKKISLTVPENEEYLYIIKSGTLDITINHSENKLVKGSIAILMPGEIFTLQNKTTVPCAYYVMKYSSNLPVDMERGYKAGGSMVKNWNSVTLIMHDKGGIRNFFERPTAMCKRMEMHVTTLNSGIKSHNPHTHRAEEIVLMVDGNTEMQIGQELYKGVTGSVFYLGSNVLHAIRNEGTIPCVYFAFQFE